MSVPLNIAEAVGKTREADRSNRYAIARREAMECGAIIDVIGFLSAVPDHDCCVKRGEAAALELLGYGDAAAVAIEDVQFTPRRVAIGKRVAISFALRSTARTEQDVLVDLGVHFVKATGKTSRKVFKLKRLSLAPRARVELDTSISLAVHLGC